MKKILRAFLIVLAVASISFWLVAAERSRKVTRNMVTCTGLRVEIRDSTKYCFVHESDIENLIRKNYGKYIGQKADSVRLGDIEKALNGKSAILKTEAYMTRDGWLTVEVTQREPIAEVHADGARWFLDETGYYFPYSSSYKRNVEHVVVKGQKRSTEDIIKVISYLESNRSWKHVIGRFSVEPDGKIYAYPIEGRERFLLGNGSSLESKFEKIEDYYRYIVPSKEDGYYSYVDVRYKGQIICKK